MPRSTIANRYRQNYDNQTELRSYAAAALSATASSTGVALPISTLQKFKAIANFAAYTGYAAGTAEWVITLEASATLGSGYVAVETFIPVGAAVTHEWLLSSREILNKVANAAFMRVTATKTGTPGNLTFGVHLTMV